MKRIGLLVAAVAAVLLALVSAPGGAVRANHPAIPQPLLNCADVNGDGSAAIGDITLVVSKFGANDPAWTANGSYHPLYDLSTQGATNGSITIGDIIVAVSDFGLSCAQMSPVDTEIAQAALALLNKPDPPGGGTCPGSALLSENQACLQEHGYYQSSFDVPGQGVHWVNDEYFADDLYDPAKPEGLVYKAGRLRAHLYFVDGFAVGWGPEPPPIENVDIDQFCTPMPPNTRCSWFGGADGWHLHQNLCTYAIGTPQAANTFTSTAADCEAIHNGACDGGKCANSTWRWNARVGWMGHMWNHMLNQNTNPLDVNGNGRFADCIPDMPWHWTGFNCPQ